MITRQGQPSHPIWGPGTTLKLEGGCIFLGSSFHCWKHDYSVCVRVCRGVTFPGSRDHLHVLGNGLGSLTTGKQTMGMGRANYASLPIAPQSLVRGERKDWTGLDECFFHGWVATFMANTQSHLWETCLPGCGTETRVVVGFEALKPSRHLTSQGRCEIGNPFSHLPGWGREMGWMSLEPWTGADTFLARANGKLEIPFFGKTQ